MVKETEIEMRTRTWFRDLDRDSNRDGEVDKGE